MHVPPAAHILPTNVASCNENFLRISGGKFIFTLSGFMQNTRTTGALT